MAPCTITIFAGDVELARGAAESVIALARAAIAQRGRFLCALSGGSTPRRLYQMLAEPSLAPRIEWSAVHVFWGDERCVPPNDPRSNYQMARHALLEHVPIRPAHIHRIRGEDEPARAAQAYEETLVSFFGGSSDQSPARSFDLVLLGLGTDGHTASLFPGSPLLTDTRRWVAAQQLPTAEPPWRITLTPAVINAAATVTFLVTGSNKAARLAEVLGAAASDAPAKRIEPKLGELRWMVDAAAATRLQATRSER